MKTSTYPSVEPDSSSFRHLLCGRSILSGVLISFMAYMILTSLGAGVVGFGAASAIQHETGGVALATGAGLWLGLSAVIALFLGSYFSARLSTHVTAKVGAAHGFVVASVFFIFMMLAMSSGIGSLSRGLATVADGIKNTSVSVASDPQVQDTIGQALGSAHLRSSPGEVAQGLAIRLLRGDVASAKAYYSYQTGEAGPAVDAKIARLQADFNRNVKIVGERAARGLADAGWSLFVTFLVGIGAALIGGRVGAHANVDRPLVTPLFDETEPRSVTLGVFNQSGSALPYVVGWLLGVPLSILLLIAMLRSVF